MAQLLFFLLQELRKKMHFEAKLFCVEKVKKKKAKNNTGKLQCVQ